MDEEKIRTVEEINDEIERIRNMIGKDQSEYAEGKLSGLYFALGKKLNYDGEVIKKLNYDGEVIKNE